MSAHTAYPTAEPQLSPLLSHRQLQLSAPAPFCRIAPLLFLQSPPDPPAGFPIQERAETTLPEEHLLLQVPEAALVTLNHGDHLWAFCSLLPGLTSLAELKCLYATFVLIKYRSSCFRGLVLDILVLFFFFYLRYRVCGSLIWKISCLSLANS